MGVRGPGPLLRADLHGDLRPPQDPPVQDPVPAARVAAARPQRYEQQKGPPETCQAKRVNTPSNHIATLALFVL